MEFWRLLRQKVGHDKIILLCAGAAILDDDNRVLLQKRIDKNCWSFPGGVMDMDESFEETAIREVKEETGLNVVVNELIGIYSKYSDEYQNGDRAQPVLILFKCSIVGGELRCDGEETSELKYFDLNEQPELLNKRHEDMFNDLREYLKDNKVKIR
ncbi:MAG: NUDIX hydrolase [Oscillospiraceae bacterium]|nr:NUDIX hydrolase [Oscillospiraceae bacterium]